MYFRKVLPLFGAYFLTFALPAFASLSHYHPFEEYSRGTAAGILRTPDKNVRFLIHQLQFQIRDWTKEYFEGVISAIDTQYAQDPEARTSAYHSLGITNLPELRSKLNSAVTDNEVRMVMLELEEVKNRNFGYFFWTDHSATHPEDVQHAVKFARELVPPGLTDQYRFLDHAPWRARLENAVLIHDAMMSHSRKAHAELAFARVDELLPQVENPRDRLTSGMIALLHSKSTIPYKKLAEWELALDTATLDLSKEIENALKKKLSPEEFGAPAIRRLLLQLRDLDSDDIRKIIRSAEIIRVADANRPIGVGNAEKQGIRNSAGHRFLPSEDETLVLEVPDGSNPPRLVPVPRGETELRLGQTLLDNPRILPNRTLEFPLGKVSASSLVRIETELRRNDLDHWLDQDDYEWAVSQIRKDDLTASSVLLVIADILRDLPPSFKEGLIVRVRPEGLTGESSPITR